MFLGKARVQGVRKAGVLWLDYRTNEGPSLDGFFTGVDLHVTHNRTPSL